MKGLGTAEEGTAGPEREDDGWRMKREEDRRGDDGGEV
jgi:hypothetical protein